MITQNEIRSLIPENCKPFFQVLSPSLVDETRSSVMAMIEAIEIISAKTFQNKITKIFIGESPFTIRMAACTLTLTHDDEVIHSYINDVIYLDFAKIHPIQYELKVASILEEFAHCIMNIKDEPFVQKTVVQLYPKIYLCEQGQYRVCP